MKKALILGAFGQDGTYLSQYLAHKHYRLILCGRRKAMDEKGRRLKTINLFKVSSVIDAIKTYKPDEIYYLAAFHHSSQDVPCSSSELFQKSFEIHVQGLTHVLDAVKCFLPQARIFYAASSHVFGKPAVKIQNEQTPLNPICAYGISKTAGIGLCRYYRAQHGVFASVGILYNHESPLRSAQFVTQKIVQAAVAIQVGRMDRLVLGNLKARVDWGAAQDYVRAMHLILQAKKSDDFVIASGTTHSIQEFAQIAFRCVGLDYKRYVSVDRTVITKNQRGHLQGDSSKLRKITGWKPTISFSTMIEAMVEHSLRGVHVRR